ncbi:CheR family methyltransferase [Aureimonas psammosilenae]|uniref:CheR family methyltransferase n=1 Tax=Aureimonas psammosilenae TaxID=2495496 RepID=UPI0012608348|nr:CheR family methyltransferase [Aureimonas psammosilenae]
MTLAPTSAIHPNRPVHPVPAASGAILDADSLRTLIEIVRETCGITMSAAKRTMLETRLRRRLAANGLDDFASYVRLLRTPGGRADELQAFTDCVVTNQTSFFREAPHFDHLTGAELRRLAEASDRSLNIWSAAASSGQEAYSLAMIADAASEGGRLFDWSVLATDISVRMLEAVREGIYSEEDIQPVPTTLRQQYLRPLKGGRAEVCRPLRQRVRIGQINLMHERYMPGRVMDIIFCRNVLIYFDPQTQVEVVEKLCRHLRPGGLLVLGHSEALRTKHLPLKLLRSNIHERVEAPL